MDPRLTIGWLYASKMNIYGDRGNVIALRRRAEWRGIPVEVREIGMGEPIPADVDCFFWGGGQDQEQAAVARDLQGRRARRCAPRSRMAPPCLPSAAAISFSVTSTGRTPPNRCPGSVCSTRPASPDPSDSSATSSSKAGGESWSGSRTTAG